MPLSTAALHRGLAVIKNSLRQEGMALLSTMILLLAVTATLATIFYRHQLATGAAARALHSDQAMLLALSAESWTSQLLSNAEDDRDSDSLDENWAHTLPPLPLEGGQLRGCLRDLQAKININNFAQLTTLSGSLLTDAWMQLVAESAIQLQRPNQPYEVLAAVVDWLDENDQPMANGGQEYYPYQPGQPERFPANRTISDIEEMAVVEGVGLPLAHQLERYTTALPRTTPVNLNTAEQKLLRALGEADNLAGEAFSDWAIARRPFATLAEFHAALANYSNRPESEVAAIWSDQRVSVKSDYFELLAEITLGNVALEYRATLDRLGRDKPVVIARSLAWVPTIAAPSSEAEALRQQRELGSLCQISFSGEV